MKMTDTLPPLGSNELLCSPRFGVSAERRTELIAELEQERQWHLSEIAYNERTIAHHQRSVSLIEDEIAAHKWEAA